MKKIILLVMLITFISGCLNKDLKNIACYTNAPEWIQETDAWNYVSGSSKITQRGGEGLNMAKQAAEKVAKEALRATITTKIRLTIEDFGISAGIRDNDFIDQLATYAINNSVDFIMSNVDFVASWSSICDETYALAYIKTDFVRELLLNTVLKRYKDTIVVQFLVASVERKLNNAINKRFPETIAPKY